MNALEHWELNKDRLAFDERGDFLAIYRHEKYDDVMFMEYYRWYAELGGALRYWNRQGYVRQRTYDLNMIRKDLDPTYRVKKRRMVRGA